MNQISIKEPKQTIEQDEPEREVQERGIESESKAPRARASKRVRDPRQEQGSTSRA